jgi:hypothetical protein
MCHYEGLRKSGGIRYQLLFCTEDCNLLGEVTNTMKRSTEALLVASKEDVQVLNVGKIMCIFTMCQQITEQNYNSYR